MGDRSEGSLEKLWDKAYEIVVNTLECIKNTSDENAWGTNVVQKVLEWETWGSERYNPKPLFSRVINM